MNETGTIRCPHCHQEQEIAMPSDHCIPFVACAACGKLIEAKSEDGGCCVFCRYGTKKCPIARHAEAVK